ncbi:MULTISPECIES: Na+/H+ antiporter NhaA [unclassified Phenylobacterium]|uniref:Na+/H+ antiporter NhaA n=1 Tax=unclassified Phenylobacterium TaxID=2640670 RepID=UPI0022B49172|nr:Na+/H+ antiporter NhaA [Phenylobacterium sp. NIBR 498073]MBS0490373.1 Na+/H+ antiporter NhaA [Pseudomonadota bacterium]WGU41220.1 Na+/H+ antiporter NhaA [Phenylobacterium sp. NIBR 498073]
MARRLTLDFLKTETASGVILTTAALLAVALANSPWADHYFAFIKHEITIQIGAFHEAKPVYRWIKEGLMAIFFFVVGLEIKHEILRGELSNPRRLALPVLAALGGMIAPAGVYLMLNLGQGGAPQGWPTPTATDIAFALAALAVAGPRLPSSLRIFLLTLAIADDLGAVALIAILFTSEVNMYALGGAAASIALMALMSKWKSAPYLFYAACFALAWAFCLKSGVNTSLAGVAAAMTVPIDPRKPGHEGPLKHFMESLHPYVAYLILPLFAFAAAGFSFQGLSLSTLANPVPLGIAMGLFVGKQIGVFGFSAAVIGLKLARRPTGAKWLELYGVSLLCGVGFTMSLFIGGLAFDPNDTLAQTEVRMGVIAGSILSALVGMGVLAYAQRQRNEAND